MMRHLLIVLCLAVCAGACSRHDSANDVTLVVVNGKRITASEIRNVVLVEQQLKETTGKPIPEKRVKKWRNSTAFRLIPGEVVRELLDREFARLGVKRLAEAEATVLRRYNQRLRGKHKTIREMIASFSGDGKLLEKRMNYEIQLESYCLSLADAMRASDEEVDSRMELERDWKREALALNSNAWVKAEACYRELAAGAAWKEMAFKYSEDALVSSNNLEYAEDWMHYPRRGGTVDLEIVNALEKLEVGQFTRPIDTDYGLLIVRLTERGDADISCSRILFRLIDVALGDLDRDALKRQMEREALNQHMSALVNRLFKKADIKYPLGETITYEVF